MNSCLSVMAQLICTMISAHWLLERYEQVQTSQTRLVVVARAQIDHDVLCHTQARLSSGGPA